METCMKRVLILLLFVLVVGCHKGPGSDWECPSCGWGIGQFAEKCSNCDDRFRPQKYGDNVPVER